MSHLNNLLEAFPNLLSGSILDVGAGRGTFMIEVEKRGGKIAGVELKRENIEFAKSIAIKNNLSLNLIQAKAESLPITSGSIDFVNLCEVIEHVENPNKVLSEVYRVLKPNGEGYISVPNRFGLKDQHFHLYFINWVPRAWSDFLIKILGKHKIYDGSSGFQRLNEMHYFTYREIVKICEEVGFQVWDIRKIKITKKLGKVSVLFIPIYLLARALFFDSFHLKLIKNI